MANKVNKVIDRNGNILIDLTNDTVAPDKVLVGTKFHGADGKEYTGILPISEIESLKYRFYDYDGTLLYTFTDEEIDVMTELPNGIDHADENLTFQGWNWTLEELKSFDRTRSDRPIVGAFTITTDKKTYLYLDIPANRTLSFSCSGTLNSVDWGDGTIDTNRSHTYTAAGEYTVTIDKSEDGYLLLSTSSSSTSTLFQYIYKLKLGSTTSLALYECCRLEKINIPMEVTNFEWQALRNCKSLKYITLPRSTPSSGICYGCSTLETISLAGNLTSIPSSFFYQCYSLKNITIPDGITAIGDSTFYYCSNLKHITIPEGPTTINSQAFISCTSLKGMIIPEGVKEIGTNAFENCSSMEYLILPNTLTTIGKYAFRYIDKLKTLVIPNSVTTLSQYCINGMSLTIDLSEQTKVITLTADPGFNNKNGIIKVPQILLDQYKSASYWSNYAGIMVGV